MISGRIPGQGAGGAVEQSEPIVKPLDPILTPQTLSAARSVPARRRDRGDRREAHRGPADGRGKPFIYVYMYSQPYIYV